VGLGVLEKLLWKVDSQPVVIMADLDMIVEVITIGLN
jgi:hypothetical protein